ncbi:hypothetical protein [Microvirga antarctica]|uniref:hypothetical protein n=1 Tax=Microvirga antarctica TaxID=2819233 RepID=UPI001B3101EF|nr:hypothetical protein [Microvirga antarctica]
MQTYLGVAVLVLGTTSVSAQSLSVKEERALSNVQHEMSTCVAYYTVVKQCMIKSNFQDSARAHGQIADQLNVLAAKLGSSIGMTVDAMRSRIQLEYDDQQNLIANNCSNTSSLFTRHSARCKQVVENTDSVLAEYMRR